MKNVRDIADWVPDMPEWLSHVVHGEELARGLELEFKAVDKVGDGRAGVGSICSIVVDIFTGRRPVGGGYPPNLRGPLGRARDYTI